GLAPAPIGYAQIRLQSLTILGGAAANQYSIDDTPRNVRGSLAVSLTTGARNDSIVVGATSSNLTIDTGAGSNNVTVMPSRVSGLLLVQSTGGTNALYLNDQGDTRLRAVTMGVELRHVTAPHSTSRNHFFP